MLKQLSSMLSRRRQYLTGNARKEIERYSADRIRSEWIAFYHQQAPGSVAMLRQYL
jgi:hypothetical protein